MPHPALFCSKTFLSSVLSCIYYSLSILSSLYSWWLQPKGWLLGIPRASSRPNALHLLLYWLDSSKSCLRTRTHRQACARRDMGSQGSQESHFIPVITMGLEQAPQHFKTLFTSWNSQVIFLSAWVHRRNQPMLSTTLLLSKSSTICCLVLLGPFGLNSLISEAFTVIRLTASPSYLPHLGYLHWCAQMCSYVTSAGCSPVHIRHKRSLWPLLSPQSTAVTLLCHCPLATSQVWLPGVTLTVTVISDRGTDFRWGLSPTSKGRLCRHLGDDDQIKGQMLQQRLPIATNSVWCVRTI